jgi:multidrug efflux pump subunit AcrB
MMMPASLAVVPWLYQQIDFSLNPVSIAAMILAIGILSDDAVVMLENIARRFRAAGEKSRTITIDAINEVGNPTILADLLVVVTLLPTAYITGEMGQYVRSIPIGASAAVLFSLVVALLITPYFGFRLLPRPDVKKSNQSASSSDGGGQPERGKPRGHMHHPVLQSHAPVFRLKKSAALAHVSGSDYITGGKLSSPRPAHGSNRPYSPARSGNICNQH